MGRGISQSRLCAMLVRKSVQGKGWDVGHASWLTWLRLTAVFSHFIERCFDGLRTSHEIQKVAVLGL